MWAVRRFAYSVLLDLPTLIPYAEAAAFLALAAALASVAPLVASAIGEECRWSRLVVVLDRVVARTVDVQRHWAPRSRAATGAEERGYCQRRAKGLRIVSPRRLTPA